MAAGADFAALAAALPADVRARAARLRVRLYGSLAATGEGHGTVRAVLAGLAGHRPDDCPPDVLSTLLEGDEPLAAAIPGARVLLSRETVESDPLAAHGPSGAPLAHPNTLYAVLLDAAGTALCEREYQSVGGGFLQWRGWTPQPTPPPAYAYNTMEELRQHLADSGLALYDLALANEEAVTGASRAQIELGLERILEAMEDVVARGRYRSGVLPGPIGLQRKAPELFARAERLRDEPDGLTVALCAAAFAASEENAAGHTVVTAPTSGSSGVLPAVVHVLRHLKGVRLPELRRGLATAAVIGFLAKHNASLSGAEVGCQGEVGVASAMAAAFLAAARGCGAGVVENAAEIALEHHLGMTCDPVRGYVQIPCIERNAMGAAKAHAAFLIASTVTPGHHKVGLDSAIRAMAQTGRDLHANYRETSLGGLAAFVRC
jgi:L-serine dehydratase